MLLGLVLAAMLAAVLAGVIWPLLTAWRALPERGEFDRAVYRDQLKELERDAARGLIGADEAAGARLEIERRLLAADRAAPPPQRLGRSPLLAAAVALLVSGGAVALYLVLGAPGLPDLPYAERGPERALTAAHGPTDLAKTAAALAAKLAAQPDDAEGWLLYARTSAALRNWQNAADAYHHALQLSNSRPDVAAAYGEMLVMAADGIVTPTAHDAFAAALAKDPKNAAARYYLALGDAQAGNVDAAIAAWQKLAAEAPENAPIRAELKQRIAAAAAAVGKEPPPLAPPAPSEGPSQDEMAAMAKLPPEQREATIRSMVANLEARLKSAPDDLPGWLRLARSYAVLGEGARAAEAYEQAAKLAPDDAQIPLGEAEALLAGHDLRDPISERVVALLHRVETLAPGEPAALWYLGLAAAQARRFDEAAQYWQRLVAALPSDSAERKTVAAALDAIEKK
ncbi:MAG TPA: c-type cytochrome biogenesis protein CcmI [Stellaceae bacterium]|nr:c-type cytochrome biogenesis protein CcmI [Stellaceae bacterium]